MEDLFCVLSLSTKHGAATGAYVDFNQTAPVCVFYPFDYPSLHNSVNRKVRIRFPLPSFFLFFIFLGSALFALFEFLSLVATFVVCGVVRGG